MIPSLCLELLDPARSWPERVALAARAGYRAIEFWDWRGKDLAALRRAAGDLGLGVAAFSANRAFGAAHPAHRAGFLDEARRAVEVAARLGSRHLMVLADPLGAHGRALPAPPLGVEARLACVAETLAAAAEEAGGADVTLVLEPLNTRLDHPGYLLERSAPARDVVRTVASPHLRVLYDVYHMAVVGEDVPGTLEAALDWIGYVHLADVPGRHEPGTGRLDWAAIVGALPRGRYTGPLGFEFVPDAPDAVAARRALAILGEEGTGRR